MTTYNTTMFDNDDPNLESFIERNVKGTAWGKLTISDVNIERDIAANPGNGKMQTKVTLTLTDGTQTKTA